MFIAPEWCAQFLPKKQKSKLTVFPLPPQPPPPPPTRPQKDTMKTDNNNNNKRPEFISIKSIAPY